MDSDVALLEKLCAWIQVRADKDRAARAASEPGHEPWTLASLSGCAGEAIGYDAFYSVRDRLWAGCEAERLGRYDVMTPREAIEVVHRLIDSCAEKS